jgi:S1-C subfamily serine protease
MSDNGPDTDLPDHTVGEMQRFEPRPAPRAHLVAAFDARTVGEDSVTPERWFEPEAAGSPQDSAEPPRPTIGRGFVAVMVVVSIFAAFLGAGGTYAVLRVSGALNDPAPTTTAGPQLRIESDASTVIAAVNKVGPAVVQIVANDGAGNTAVGSGIIYDPRGWILTNAHVVKAAKTITVRLSDDRRLAGITYGFDTLTDLAIVKIDGIPDLTMAALGDSSSLQVGQLAIAIGSPLGLAYPNSVSRGIVSALGRDIEVPASDTASATSLRSLIQTDASINPGNSGGPLVDGSGRVIGITTAEVQTATGIGFAIPIDIAKPIMQQALAGEKLSRPFIGVSYDSIDRGLEEHYSLALSQGAWVHLEDAAGNSIEAVVAGSPGDKAGIKTGDILTKMEGESIDPSHRLEDMLVKYAPGRTITLEAYRGGSYITLRVTLGTRPSA